MKLKFWTKPKPEKTVVPTTFSTIDELKKLLEKEKCPSCRQIGKYYIINYQKGNPEWEAKIQCGQCNTTATINHTGFHFDFTYETMVKHE